jgi:putative addiction module killer protein
MRGYLIWPTKKQRPEFWRVSAVRYLEIFGDCEPVGEGVSEMRIHVGGGYRVYYVRTGSTVYVLLAGGVKASQTKDIAKAKKMARELKKGKQ